MPEWYAALPERDLSLSSRWATAEFREELRTWCESVVGPVVGMEQHKLRGWATVWRVTTSEGAWFAKQNCPGQQVEVALMDALSRLAPDRVVPVTAARDGFLLTPDQGPVFYETAGGDLENWVRLARDAALLQRELVPHHEELLATGMTELTSQEAPDYVAARVDQYAALGVDDPRRLEPDVADRLRAHLPVVRRWAEQVASLGLPLTLNHNDLHENNVFDVEGRLRFFDFGDSLLTEPLGVLLIPLNILGEKLDADGDDPRLWRSCAPRFRRPSSWAGLGGSSRGSAVSRRRTTSSSRSGGRWPRPGSGRCSRTRRSGCPRDSRVLAVGAGMDVGVAHRAGDDGQGGTADERAGARRLSVEEAALVGRADPEHEPDDHHHHEERLHGTLL
jgi:hypothetical protein